MAQGPEQGPEGVGPEVNISQLQEQLQALQAQVDQLHQVVEGQEIIRHEAGQRLAQGDVEGAQAMLFPQPREGAAPDDLTPPTEVHERPSGARRVPRAPRGGDTADTQPGNRRRTRRIIAAAAGLCVAAALALGISQCGGDQERVASTTTTEHQDTKPTKTDKTTTDPKVKLDGKFMGRTVKEDMQAASKANAANLSAPKTDKTTTDPKVKLDGKFMGRTVKEDMQAASNKTKSNDRSNLGPTTDKSQRANQSQANSSAAANSKYELHGAGSIDSAVKQLEFATARGAATTILNNPGKYDGLKNSNAMNKQAALKSYDKDMSTADAAEGWALAVVNDPSFSLDYLNSFEGKPGNAPRHDTHEQRIAKIAQIIANENTKFDGSFRLNGTWNNDHTIQGTHQVGTQTQTFHDVRALQIVPGSDQYHAVYAKIGGGNDASGFVCLNSNHKVKLVVTRTSTNRTSVPAPSHPTGGGEQTPAKPQVPGKPTHGGGHAPAPAPQHPTGGGEQTPPTEKPKVCAPGYQPEGNRCVHKPAGGPPPEASQPPYAQPGTPGYTPGRAEDVDSTQHGDPTNLDPTPNGTEAPNGSPASSSPDTGGGTPEPTYNPGDTSQETDQGASQPVDTNGNNPTPTAPGSDTGMPN